jgi:hypothetical protein
MNRETRRITQRLNISVLTTNQVLERQTPFQIKEVFQFLLGTRTNKEVKNG